MAVEREIVDEVEDPFIDPLGLVRRSEARAQPPFERRGGGWVSLGQALRQGELRHLLDALVVEPGGEPASAQPTPPPGPRPDDCWCAGRGGDVPAAVVVYDQPPRAESLLPPRVLAAVLDEQGEPVWGFRRYCGCPEGQAALERSRQARERFLERRAREQLAQRLRAIWETAAIPGAARHWTFESYLEHVQALHERRLVSSRDLRRAETAVLFLREDWLPSLDWLVLWGPPGGGKTGLAIAALRALVERDQCTALYVTVPELLDRLKATFDRVRGSEEARFDEVLESLARVEVLLLDDVGVEQRTPFNQEQLFKILNRRLLEHAENSRRRTILTTNLAVPQELAQHLDPRIMSRLRGASASYELALVDLRQRLPARGERG